MKKLLVISYFFPPQGGPGAVRWTRLTKYFVGSGIDCFIIAPSIIHDPDLIDRSLCDQVNKKVYVFRAYNPDMFRIARNFMNYFRKDKQNDLNKMKPKVLPTKYKSISLFIKSFFFMPDQQILWFPFALVMSIFVIKKYGIKVFVTSSKPHSLHLIGLVLKKFLRITWIAEFRDDWVDNPDIYFPTKLHKRIHEYFEKKVITTADHINITSRDFSKKYPKFRNKIVNIRSGFDEELYDDSLLEQYPKMFEIIFVGTLYRKLKIENFFKVISELMASNENLRKVISISIIGKSYDEDIYKLAEINGLRQVVKIYNFVENSEIPIYLSKAAVLLILSAEDSDTAKELYSAKLFEYLRARRNILAIMPEGASTELIHKLNCGFSAEYDNFDLIKKQIMKLFSLWEEGKAVLPKHPEINKFSFENMANQYINLLRNEDLS